MVTWWLFFLWNCSECSLEIRPRFNHACYLFCFTCSLIQTQYMYVSLFPLVLSDNKFLTSESVVDWLWKECRLWLRAGNKIAENCLLYQYWPFHSFRLRHLNPFQSQSLPYPHCLVFTKNRLLKVWIRYVMAGHHCSD